MWFRLVTSPGGVTRRPNRRTRRFVISLAISQPQHTAGSQSVQELKARELRQEIGPAAGSDNDIPTRLAGLPRERHVSHRAFLARHHWGRPPEKTSNYRRTAPRLSSGITHRTICRRHPGVSQSGARHAETTLNLQSQRND
ncbi:hypothetical protein [Mycobacteroides abscessus]|uniref:hypothetical protein n=1 Tax=Mycobacteroides abscessus TaxID=36809 RepID=UPI0002683D03|nr:hypothetical protein [Mycobacteroides abscessus]EIV21570.1 hypothetical protein MA3A0119R_4773 [Mycobacteroides abscessus 3A-0119-R]EIV23973.1 hypothetical protein MA3A0122R_4872 [Mycobacteroides abscessus 3A-0122-R]EIV31689.1 hypothetical protein MA3A0122S_4626 [Mycobacteroides abscessus 3A-0122-S]EIV35082.1 hypothetical protein MA3A0731_4863 [Mycobacteroides abscessus 3A-0731]EIV44084.1 hypothetical protein MA3A0930R_4785 [Mycobacteroides abscessus 3A-0930-R]